MVVCFPEKMYLFLQRLIAGPWDILPARSTDFKSAESHPPLPRIPLMCGEGQGVLPTTLLPHTPPSPPFSTSSPLFIMLTSSRRLYKLWPPIFALISPSRLVLLSLLSLFPIFVPHDLFTLFSSIVALQ